jgi:hypothetical protein
MPSKRVFTNGWVFWLARHPKYGVILFDRTDQTDVPDGCMRVFEGRGSTRCILPNEVLKSETSAEVTDNEFVQIVNLYNGLKASLDIPIKAPGYDAGALLEEKHKRFLLERGLPDNGICPAEGDMSHRVTHCWSCKGHLDSSVDIKCVTCGWIICGCGACGCGR